MNCVLYCTMGKVGGAVVETPSIHLYLSLNISLKSNNSHEFYHFTLVLIQVLL